MIRIQLIFKYLTLAFFAIAILSITIGQILPFEFSNWKNGSLLYDIILQGLPVAILLTIIWTIKKSRRKSTNIIIAILTPMAAIIMLFTSYFLMFSFGFGAWVNLNIIYRNAENPKVSINQQVLDIGAFGYGGKRTVKLSPFLGLWNIVEQADTSKINVKNWNLVNEQGDIKFP